MESDVEVEEIPVVAVAVNGSKNSKYAVKWALEEFVPEGVNSFKLLHVRPKITTVPTPMGNVPISQVREDVATAHKADVEHKTNMMLLPYQNMCLGRRVEPESIVIEADLVPEAISEEIIKLAITKLVIGYSSRNTITRKLKGRRMSSKISECAPSFCTIYVVHKGNLSSVRASTTCFNENIQDDASVSTTSRNLSNRESTSQSESTDFNSSSRFSNFDSPSLQSQRSQALRAINQNISSGRWSLECIHNSRRLSQSTEEDISNPSSSFLEIPDTSSQNSIGRESADDMLCNPNVASSSDNMPSCSTSEDRVDVGFELERLRIELRHLRGVCEETQNETTDASKKMSKLNALYREEKLKIKEMLLREDKARELAKMKRKAREEAEKEAEYMRGRAEQEVQQRHDANDVATQNAQETVRLERILSDQQFKYFEWEDIVSATSSFSDTNKIGEGANGAVYKARLNHTLVAIKAIHSDVAHITKQFRQELDVLGRIHHPNLLLLLGACPDHGCLVYEFMENGSLDDRLKCKNNAPPLQWFHRYKIAWEVSSALFFLHNAHPNPIIHRDLKPANILLDHNLVAKIGDVGLSTLAPVKDGSMISMCKHTSPVGTFCYIDPEYQRTGIVSQKSDIYSLGMVILQLLTGEAPIGIAHVVETAMENGHLADVLDSKAGPWPVRETEELAILGLCCVELRRKDRPDLKTQVLPLLEKLKRMTDDIRESSHIPVAPPSHFICPILQEVMEEPYVAADGYTYDRRAIEKWLTINDKSPLTNLPLPSKHLIPNHSLIAAIKEWNSSTNHK